MENGKEDSEMERECACGRMEQSTMGSGKMALSMVKVHSTIHRERASLGNGRMEEQMALEFIRIHRDQCTQA